MQAAYFTTADFAARNRATVGAFRRVIDEAGAYANEHHDRMIPVIAAFTGIPVSVVTTLPPQYVATSLDVRLIQPVIDVAAKFGSIPARFDARGMIVD